jgi:GTPase SAR1 family protein
MELGRYHDPFAGEQAFVISPDERRRHVYIVGRSGSGKTSLLYNLARGDLERGDGLCLIDPHGDLFADLLDSVPRRRVRDCILIDLADREALTPFNPLAGVEPDHRHVAAANLLSAFKSIWDSWGPRLEWFLQRGISLLLEHPERTLLDLPRLYYDRAFLKKLSGVIQDPALREFWTAEYPSYNDRYREDAMGPILNKVGQFLASPPIRFMLSQTHPRFDFAQAMGRGQIVLVNLAKGLIGDEPANLLGSLLIAHIKTTALARAALPPEARRDFHLIVDEFQSFGTTVFADILSEARKYGLTLAIAHQFTEQLRPEIRAAVLGNAGTLIAFRVGAPDATLLAREFHPLPEHALTDQFPFQARVKRGMTLENRAVTTIAPQKPLYSNARRVRRYARMHFGRKIS